MKSLIGELEQIAYEITKLQQSDETVSARNLLFSLENRADSIGCSSSCSWLGYHANIYTVDLKPPPAGENFDPMRGFLIGRQPHWIEYSFDDIRGAIEKHVSPQDVRRATQIAYTCEDLLVEKRGQVDSIIQTFAQNIDPFLEKVTSEIHELSIHSEQDIISALTPKSAIASRDHTAFSQGIKYPPHISSFVRNMLLRTRIDNLGKFARQLELAAAHMKRVSMYRTQSANDGSSIFIGHGQSRMWLELKDFLQDRLNLTCDDFDRVSPAGLPITGRLSRMLDSAIFAFLVMTAEDEQPDGEWHPRMNVIHEAGLFQGRLGFDKAIILLEENCKEFSNIHGLVQIRFPKDDISARFEEVRQVLEDRGILAR